MDSVDKFREKLEGILNKAEETARGDEVTRVRELRKDVEMSLG